MTEQKQVQSKTTMIYTHVTQTSLKNIKNPFDELQKKIIFMQKYK